MKKGIGIVLAFMMTVSMAIPVSAAEENNGQALTTGVEEQAVIEDASASDKVENTDQSQFEKEESSEEITEEEKNQSDMEGTENTEQTEEGNQIQQEESADQGQESKEGTEIQPETTNIEEQNDVAEQSLESRAANSFRIEGTVLKEYTGTGGAVTIPSYVTEISNWAFSNKGGDYSCQNSK